MEKCQVLTLVLVPLLFVSLAATGTNLLIASTTEEEEASDGGLPFITPETTTSAPAPPTTTATAANASADYVRARIMLFGVPPTSPNIVTWLNVPNANATSADTITATELDATNNVTGDGIGELFISLPNTTAQINQQVQACALDVVSQAPQCDSAFVAATNASTMLQILLGNPSSAAAAPAPAAIQ